MLPHLSIDYDEPDPATYRGIKIRLGGREALISSDPPNPTRDFAVAVIWAARTDAPSYMTSSSVDHFVMDGGTLDDSDASVDSFLQDESVRADVLALEGSHTLIPGP